MSLIFSSLTNDTLPNDKALAHKIRGGLGLPRDPWGVYSNHSDSRSLAQKAFRQGYFWPTIHRDTIALVKRCEKCQRFSNIPHVSAEPLTPIVSPWPFAQLGLDLTSLMSQGKRQVKYAVVAIDYFTKWVEAEALATITVARIEDFVRTHICCRFGIPYAIITDNGKQFDLDPFQQFCNSPKINLFFASPAHP
ncbi:hypothetical protein L3X38_005568 [Prunus dulcis]|uniref:Integrase catalytic domain-containing protein n=1 Tax=Prunus dulcis TaxID=3755 RepID=A0AAD4ZR95_PRUDU|nr:hypothetical protein L3X38_005568 [Prunus dulcis]